MWTEDDTMLSEESINSNSSSEEEVENQSSRKKAVIQSDDSEKSPVVNRQTSNAGNFSAQSTPAPSDDEKQNEVSTARALLGSDVSESSSDSEKERASKVGEDEDEADADAAEDQGKPDNKDDASQEPQEETKISVDFPFIKADLGSEIHMVKLPNFLSIETRPFDQDFYENEAENTEVMDEEGRTRLKLKVENTIRWRVKKPSTPPPSNEADSKPEYESNARIVKWSDGSHSLYLGEEIFDIHAVDIRSDYNHLFIREGSGLQAQTVFKDKLTFRPLSTDSFTHRKITMSLVDKSNKSQKVSSQFAQVKILPVAGADPESSRSEMIKREEEKLRATVRREAQQRRMRERQLASAASRGVSGGGYARVSGADDDFIDDANTFSVGAAKKKARSKKAPVYSDSDSLSDISEAVSYPKRNRVIHDESD